MPTWRASPDDWRRLEGPGEDRNPSIKENFLHQSDVFGFWEGFPHLGEQYCTVGRLKGRRI